MADKAVIVALSEQEIELLLGLFSLGAEKLVHDDVGRWHLLERQALALDLKLSGALVALKEPK